MDLRAHFSRFRAANAERIHLAAHSHHYWPDVTFAAQQQCWQDAAALADAKWDRVFGEVVPAAQRLIAGRLGLGDGSSIAFAPNTHDFVRRILSCLPATRPPRVLTTEGEFYSFDRQVRRLAEDGLLSVERVPWRPFATFGERLADAAQKGAYDLVFVSQVAFDTGYCVSDLPALVIALQAPDRLVVIDGYHAFMAVPTDLAEVADRVFYLAGGYKYAMAGEGACFLHMPPQACERPRDTGWFAGFDGLAAGAAPHRGVAYDAGGRRFFGATFDPCGLYRLLAVQEWLQRESIDVAAIHAHAHRLQQVFVDELRRLDARALPESRLVVPLAERNRGNFLAYELPDAQATAARLRARGIITDARGSRLRVGFGIYHVEDEIRAAAARAATLG